MQRTAHSYQFAFFVAVTALSASTHACFNPADQWATGVAFNDGERVDFSVIESIGVPGSDFLKSGAGDSLKIRYRSHYAPAHAMVYLGYFAVSFQPVGTVPRMAIVLDTTQDKTAFNFAAAVRRELDWMANPDPGIIALSMQVRNEIEDSLQSAAHGDTQYWTRQRRVLSYNQWYTGDSLNGVWSTNGVRGGCGLDAQFTLPVDSFTALSRGHTYAIVPGNARFAAIDLNTQTTTMVDAVKELSGQYYCIFMSRLPDFWNKTVKGYFDTDFVLFVGANATVFVETEIVGERTNEPRSHFPSFCTFVGRLILREAKIHPIML